MSVWGGIGAAVGLAQGAYNLYKDITNTDTNRSVAASGELMEQQQGYNKENMSLANDYNVAMYERQKAAALEALGIQQDFAREMQQEQFKYGLNTMAKQASYNAQLSDKGRAVAQMRMAGLNPAAASSPATSGSVSAPTGSSGSSPSAAMPSGGMLSPMSVAPSSATVSHYTASASDLTDAGIKLDTMLSQLNKERDKALEQKYNAEKAKHGSDREKSEAKKAAIEADRHVEMIEARIENLEVTSDSLWKNAEANWKNALTAEQRQQADQRYQEASIKIQDELNKLKERGVKINEAKLWWEIKDIAADIAYKNALAESEGQTARILRKDYLNYEHRIDAVVNAQNSQAAYFNSQKDFTDTQDNWYAVKAIMSSLTSGMLGFAAGLSRSAPTPIKGFSR